MLSGPLIGVGLTTVLGGLFVIVLAIVLLGPMNAWSSIRGTSFTWWVLAMLVGGALLAGAGPYNSRRRLRHWEARRAAQVTYAAGALSVAGALLIYFAVSGVGIVIDITGADPFVRILVLVAALLGLVPIGRFVWPRMGRVVRG